MLQQQQTIAQQPKVEFGLFTALVEMPAGHKAFVTHLAGLLQMRGANKQLPLLR